MSELQTTSAYPVQLSVARPLSSSRFWAIPLVGILVKCIILIPHFVVLYVLGLVVAVLQLVIWIPVLFTGRYPDWAFGLVGGLLYWWMRVTLFIYGISDRYPPFSMDTGDGVAIGQPQSSSRFFAIPIIGIVVRSILLIPHFIILYVLGIVVGLSQLVIWIPVLFGGTYPDWAFTLVGGTTLWSVRVYGYLLGLTDRYPPFAMS